MLEEVVEGGIFLDEVLLRTGEETADGGEVLGGDDLAVAVAVEGEGRATSVSDVIGRVVVDKPFEPWHL